MDRQIIKSGQIPLETDILSSERSTMIGLGWALQTALGTGTAIDGLACTPSAPANLIVNIGAGAIYFVESVDPASYSTLPADTVNQIVKQGLLLGGTTFTLTAPSTSGFSQNYLIEAIYSDTDDTPIVRPYYDSANPSVAFSGPGGSGTPDNTFRRGKCVMQVKAGTPATTGTQATPVPDVGYVGAWVVTVANGQTAITSGSIAQYPSAPFIQSGAKLGNLPTAIQNSNWIGQDDTGSANAYSIAPSPPPTALSKYQRFIVKIANTNTAASTLSVLMASGSTVTASIVLPGGTPTPISSLLTGAIAEFTYDGTNFQLTGGANTITGLTLSAVYLAYASSTQIVLQPNGGQYIPVGGKLLPIPANGIISGLTGVYVGGVASQNLAASTVYDVFVFSNGGVATFDFWATGGTEGHAPDSTAGNVGVEVRTVSGVRQTGWTYVGKIATTATPTFQPQGTGVISWFNRQPCPIAGALVTGSESTATPTELNTAGRASFLSFNPGYAEIGYFSYTQPAASHTGAAGVGVDGAYRQGSTTAVSTTLMAILLADLSEGQHTITPFGFSDGSSTTVFTDTFVQATVQG